MKKNLRIPMLELVSDGYWHPKDELVEKISHRFPATFHDLDRLGYKFEKRYNQSHYEYRQVTLSKITA